MDHDLLDSIETTYSIECIPCGCVEESDMPSTVAAARQFERQGWKRNEDGEVVCPQCQKL